MYKHFAAVFFIAKVTPCFSNKCTLFDIKGNMGKKGDAGGRYWDYLASEKMREPETDRKVFKCFRICILV